MPPTGERHVEDDLTKPRTGIHGGRSIAERYRSPSTYTHATTDVTSSLHCCNSSETKDLI
jgi:hypothetical protein